MVNILLRYHLLKSLFFFQAKVGIRDPCVTGVQTCALPISGVPIVATISVTGTKATCTGAATTFTITVNPQPVVTAVGNVAVCPATAINIPLTSNVAGAVLDRKSVV